MDEAKHLRGKHNQATHGRGAVRSAGEAAYRGARADGASISEARGKAREAVQKAQGERREREQTIRRERLTKRADAAQRTAERATTEKGKQRAQERAERLRARAEGREVPRRETGAAPPERDAAPTPQPGRAQSRPDFNTDDPETFSRLAREAARESERYGYTVEMRPVGGEGQYTFTRDGLQRTLPDGTMRRPTAAEERDLDRAIREGRMQVARVPMGGPAARSTYPSETLHQATGLSAAQRRREDDNRQRMQTAREQGNQADVMRERARQEREQADRYDELGLPDLAREARQRADDNERAAATRPAAPRDGDGDGRTREATQEQPNQTIRRLSKETAAYNAATYSGTTVIGVGRAGDTSQYGGHETHAIISQRKGGGRREKEEGYTVSLPKEHATGRPSVIDIGERLGSGLTLQEARAVAAVVARHRKPGMTNEQVKDAMQGDPDLALIRAAIRTRKNPPTTPRDGDGDGRTREAQDETKHLRGKHNQATHGKGAARSAGEAAYRGARAEGGSVADARSKAREAVQQVREERREREQTIRKERLTKRADAAQRTADTARTEKQRQAAQTRADNARARARSDDPNSLFGRDYEARQRTLQERARQREDTDRRRKATEEERAAFFAQQTQTVPVAPPQPKITPRAQPMAQTPDNPDVPEEIAVNRSATRRVRMGGNWDQPASDKQKAWLKDLTEKARAGTREGSAQRRAADELRENLDKLTKWEASQLIDGLRRPKPMSTMIDEAHDHARRRRETDEEATPLTPPPGAALYALPEFRRALTARMTTDDALAEGLPF